jgi:hypothetical protein
LAAEFEDAKAGNDFSIGCGFHGALIRKVGGQRPDDGWTPDNRWERMGFSRRALASHWHAGRIPRSLRWRAEARAPVFQTAMDRR